MNPNGKLIPLQRQTLARVGATISLLCSPVFLSACSEQSTAPTAENRSASTAALKEADTALNSGNTDVAEKAWRHAIELDSTNPAPYASIALHRWKSKQYTEAARNYEEASKRDPKSTEYIFAEIETLQAAGDQSKFEQLARRAVSIEPENPKALVYLGHHLATLSDKPGALDEARHLLEHATQLAPGMPIPFIELGRLLLKQRDYSAAETYLVSAWEMLHHGQKPLRQLESMAILEKRRAETAYALTRCAISKSDKAGAARWQAQFKAVDARIEKRSQLATLSERNPPDLNALASLAALDIETGGAMEAVELVKRGLSINPQDTKLLQLADKLQHTQAESD